VAFEERASRAACGLVMTDRIGAVMVFNLIIVIEFLV
jgi:hypothetical protein